MMLIGVNEEVLEGFEIERKWQRHINNSTLLQMHKERETLEKKLEIARKSLNEIGDAIALYFRREHTKDFAEDTLMGIGIVVGQTEQALKEIKE